MRRLATALLTLAIASSGLGARGIDLRDQDTRALDPASAALISAAAAMLDQMVRRDFVGPVAHFDAAMKTALPEERLRDTWVGLIARAGAFRAKQTARVEAHAPYRIVVLTCAFERGLIDVQFVFDQAGDVAGLSVKPTVQAVEYTPPSYVQSGTFVETEITVGTGEWALPGTLTMPNGAGPFPAVVLVHGSGPNDRDETMGPNKVFRDLALGLASKGVAVLRYEKRTKQYAGKLGSVGAFTVKDETIDDALAAVARLRQEPKIAPAKIFVVGHSLGGMLVPRIGVADTKLAGLVVMAGAVRSLQQSMLDQTKYLAMVDGAISPAEQAQIDALEQLVSTVRDLKAEDATSPRIISGAPASYWYDLRGYDPPAAARALKQPLLILQGERDYQVTMDDFAKWKTALTSKPGVTFHTYPALNHYFIAGAGKSGPAEYAVTGHVSEDVIRDIAEWIKAIH